MIKLGSKRFCIRFACAGNGSSGSSNLKGSSSSSSSSSSSQLQAGQKICRSSSSSGGGSGNYMSSEIKWEVRPGGMLVQRRSKDHQSSTEDLITIRVSTVSLQWHDVLIEPTSAFGELKMILSLVTGLEPREQRLLFKGKERDDSEFLHMVGVRDRDKVLLLQDPAIKEMKLHGIGPTTPTCGRTISV